MTVPRDRPDMPMTPLPTLLVTGFEPFGGDAFNSSRALARSLEGEVVGGAVVEAAELPTRFGATDAALRRLLARRRPGSLRAVLAIGQAASRSVLSFERVAINWADARIADNDGAQPIDAPVLARAPAAYFTTLPIKAMVAASRAAGVPAEVSYSAGSFVCNQLFFLLQHRLRLRPAVASGFLHVPALPGPLSLEQMAAGTLAALASIGPGTRVEAVTGGRTSEGVVD
jgi:pyroglutamyl-peptidase